MGIKYYDNYCPDCKVQLNSENYFQPPQAKEFERERKTRLGKFLKWMTRKNQTLPNLIGQNGICNDCNWKRRATQIGIIKW